MQAHADALPQPLELAGEERGRHPVLRSGRGYGEFDQRGLRRDASATYDPARVRSWVMPQPAGASPSSRGLAVFSGT